MYGIDVYLTVDLDGKARPPQNVLNASIRVVLGDDGKRVKTANGSRVKKSGETFRDVFRALSTDLLTELALPGLPGVVEAAPPAPAAPPLVLVPPPSPPSDETRVQTYGAAKESRHPVLEPVGYTALGVGGAALVAGVVVFATSRGFRTNSIGLVLQEDAGFIRPTQDQQRVGVGLMVSGGVVAAVGAVLTILAHKQTATLRGSIVPMTDGAAAVIGGEFR
jgi:hypothetical protein